jgi:hypothetical protein
MAKLKQLSYTDSFRQQKILTVYLLYIQGTTLYVKEKCNCAVKNKYIHTTQEIIMTITGMYII